ncbi:MAG: hypothetical protein M1818_003565 [Claussenomyces sp. TS43310]|nr:MAG: hypothetical protein M1818_003565 [Claussenomyces sp. TS43310]
MADPPVRTRKTRFVCVSDTHNASPNGAFKLPKGDVLIHAGDLTNQGNYSELRNSVQWIEDADFEAKIVIAGNHDVTLDSTFYGQYGSYFHNQGLQDIKKCQDILEESSSITYLRHESAIIRLSSSDGPRTSFKIFGSPYSPAKGMWAFGYSPEEATHIWDKIPLDSDIVVTHTPPKCHCDERRDRRAAGCDALRFCGHVHESRGAEIIKWDLEMSNHKYKEDGVERWTDPGEGNKKISLVNLDSKRGRGLLNDGSVGDVAFGGVPNHHPAYIPLQQPPAPAEPCITSNRSPTTLQKALTQMAANLLALPSESLTAATRGQGGLPPSSRCDLEALSGRLGRKETCVVNAAILASSWPYKGHGGKKFNKPIVVDLDLPTWYDE